ncbi:unnamed protein product [Blepharisma stoltei]|uniref:USP domain-containing protein n=1 Tax=Blepharisma stoltei TaxID=1481888 RepID=A0AAU9IFS8_9CILI|nr:unnamed protein product [Blepharisma stoltei]
MEKVYAKKNQLFCENCKGKRKIKIKMVEHKWPEVLVLYFPEESRQVKLDENLDVGECKFLLYGVIKYIGSGMFGHYTAMTKDGKIWNIYNDDKVYKTQFEEEDKYLAFYKRINN